MPTPRLIALKLKIMQHDGGRSRTINLIKLRKTLVIIISEGNLSACLSNIRPNIAHGLTVYLGLTVCTKDAGHGVCGLFVSPAGYLIIRLWSVYMFASIYLGVCFFLLDCGSTSSCKQWRGGSTNWCISFCDSTKSSC